MKHTEKDGYKTAIYWLSVLFVFMIICIIIAFTGQTHTAKALVQSPSQSKEFIEVSESSVRYFDDTKQRDRQKKNAKQVYEQLTLLKSLQAQKEAEAEEYYYEEVYYDYSYYEPAYYEPTYYDYSSEFSGEMSAEEFRFQGVVYDDGVRYTYYSQNVLPGGGLTELNNNGRHVDGGYVKDGDGYIAVASSDYPIGTVVDTPFGEAKVYDTGCASGTIDVYTNF